LSFNGMLRSGSRARLAHELRVSLVPDAVQRGARQRATVHR
jgi:hypothetical protein